MGYPLSPAMLREVAIAVLQDGLFFHSNKPTTPSMPNDTQGANPSPSHANPSSGSTDPSSGGAGPSSARAGPSSARASSSSARAGPSSEGAGPSSHHTGPSSGYAGTASTAGGGSVPEPQHTGGAHTLSSHGKFATVSLDHSKPSHPDLTKIADEKFKKILPYIIPCVHPKGRHVQHFRHELLLELATIALHIFLTKYPHLRSAYNTSEHLSRSIFASICGIVSLFFIKWCMS